MKGPEKRFEVEGLEELAVAEAMEVNGGFFGNGWQVNGVITAGITIAMYGVCASNPVGWAALGTAAALGALGFLGGAAVT